MTGMTRHTGHAIVAAALLILAVGCSVPLKERAVRHVQALDLVLSHAQDAELSLYESGTVAALTPDRHKAFHAALYTAMDATERLAIALLAWRAGDPAPDDVASVLAAAKEALAALEAAVPEASAVLGHVRAWLETAIALQAIFSGGAL